MNIETKNQILNDTVQAGLHEGDALLKCEACLTIPIKINHLTLGKGKPKICVPLTSAKEADLYEEAKRAMEAGPDLVEWRADCFEHLMNPDAVKTVLCSLKTILEDIPLIFTIRTKAEGGKADLCESDYLNINQLAAQQGQADLIDIEVFAGGDRELFLLSEKKKEFIHRIHTITKCNIIASSHDFEKTDTKELLLKRFMAMNESGADILKMAVMPVKAEDVDAIMEATDLMRKEYTSRPLVSMSMGEMGKISRIQGEKFGSAITFATVGEASAPGQIPLEKLREML